jgi:general secretion pathway protein K
LPGLLDRPQSKGMALIAVLWIVSLLALMAAGVGSSGRVSGKLAFNAAENARARALAEAGLNRAAYHLLTGEPFRAPLVDGAVDLSFAVEEGLAAVLVRDEDGKIDINAAPIELLSGLLLSIGVKGEDEAEALAARIIDFRDEDSDVSSFGAEDADYEAAGLRHGANDRPFRHIEELRTVLGMTDQLQDRLRRHLTIYADAEGFDFFRASVPVLGALPGMTPETVAKIRSAWPDDDIFSVLQDDAIARYEDYALATRELVYNVRVLAKTNEGGSYLLEAILALDGGRGALPYTTYEWRRGTLSDDDPLITMMRRLETSSRAKR